MTREERTYPSLRDLLASRGVRRLQHKPDDFLEDGYDFGFQWRGPGSLVYRLTWLGPIGRTANSAAPGELYLLALGLANSGTAELLCVIPPVEGEPAANVREILNGWEDVCGEPNSVDWVRDRVGEALRAGWATKPEPAPTHETEKQLRELFGPKTDEERRKRVLAVITENVRYRTSLNDVRVLAAALPHTHGLVDPFDRECSPEKRCVRCEIEAALDDGGQDGTDQADPAGSLEAGGDRVGEGSREDRGDRRVGEAIGLPGDDGAHDLVARAPEPVAAPDHAWTPEAALAFIKARPGDKDADAIIRSLAGALLGEREQGEAALDSLERILFGDVQHRSRDDLDSRAEEVVREREQAERRIERLTETIRRYIVAIGRAPHNRDEGEIEEASKALVAVLSEAT